VLQPGCTLGAQDETVTGTIAFVREVGGNEDIYTISPDGSNLRRLTEDSARDWSPSWSPDGTRIAFTSDRDGRFSIYTMKWDGSDVTKLTSGEGRDYDPAWSPDGKTIAFSRFIGEYEQAEGRIWCLSTDDGTALQVTQSRRDHAWSFSEPAWSPDGKLLFIKSSNPETASGGISVVRFDGTGGKDVRTERQHGPANRSWRA
jgi:TolB protein